MGGTCGTHGAGEVYTGFWVGKPEGKRPLGRRRHRWENNIKMDFQDVKCSMVWLKEGTDGGLF